MNLHITGQHLAVTPAIREYAMNKLERLTRHFDQLLDIHMVFSVEKERQKVECNIHVAGRELHAEAVDESMYAAIDFMADKLDRQIVRHKEKLSVHRFAGAERKRSPIDSAVYA
jgi:putative sigma-54 modulation protein